jgi:histidyl-tRNA synthetase
MALKIAGKLRQDGLYVDLNLNVKRKIKHQLEYANKKQIPFCILVMDPKAIVVRDMVGRTQNEVTSIEELPVIPTNR